MKVTDEKLDKVKSFLECMFNNLDDIYEDSDEKVEQELLEMGIDIEKAKKSFLETVEKCKRKKDGTE
jgi:hypothetical protein